MATGEGTGGKSKHILDEELSKDVSEASKLLEKLGEQTGQTAKAMETLKEAMKDGFAAFKGNAADVAKYIEEMEGLADAQRSTFLDLISLLLDNEKEFENFGNSVDKTSKKFETLTSKVNKLAGALERAFGVGFKDVKEFVLQLDEVPKKFAATTGITEDLSKSMGAVSAKLAESGVTLGDVSNSYSAMASSLSSFVPANKEMNEQLAGGIALLGKYGVSAEKAAGNIDFLSRSLGITSEAALEVTTELASSGRAIGITSSKMIDDFRQVAGTLGIYGPRMTTTFANMQAMAKAAGMEISDLVGIANKFNTFDSAADSAGKLNAVLGTQLSTVDLLNMNHDERLATIRDEIQRTVGDFNTLDKFTQQYIADAMGFKDVGQAAKFINMSAIEQEEYARQQKESAMRQEELQKATEKFVPVMQQLKIALMEAVTQNKDLIMGIIDGIKGFSEFIKENGKMIKILGSFILILSAGVKAMSLFKSIQDLFSLSSKAAAAASTAQAGANQALSASFIRLNASMGLIVLAFAAAAFFFMNDDLVRGFSALTLGVTLLAMAFIGLDTATKKWTTFALLAISLFGTTINPLFVQAFGFMAIGVLLLAFAFKAMNGPATLAAVALALLFGAVALVIYAMKELVGLMIQSVDILPALSEGLALLAAEMFKIGMIFANPIVMAGLAVFAGGIASIGLAIKYMGTGVEKMINSLKNVKGIVADLKGVMNNSFIAITATGRKTSAVLANGNALAGINSGNIKVDVNIPKMASPDIKVKVYLDGSELRSIIKQVRAEAG